MSTLTTNLGLVKPSGNERPQVSVINANMDVLDAVIGDPSNLRSGSDITSDIKTLRDSVAKGSFGTDGIQARSYKDFAVNFGKTFPATPSVTATFVSGSTDYQFGLMSLAIAEATTSGCTVRVFNADSSSRWPSVNWIAIC